MAKADATKRYTVVIGGDRLMMHNEQLANPFNDYTQELAKVTKKKNKTLDDHLEIARIEFQGGLYHDEKAGPYMPAHCLHKMIVEGARRRKMGKEFEKAILVPQDINPVLYEGPRSRKDLGSKMDRFCDQRLVGIGKKRTMRTRPLFRSWRIEFSVVIAEPGLINPDDLRNALEAAQTIGLGDGRPVYAGQFSVMGISAE